jgi:hypothetical protein
MYFKNRFMTTRIGLAPAFMFHWFYFILVVISLCSTSNDTPCRCKTSRLLDPRVRTWLHNSFFSGIILNTELWPTIDSVHGYTTYHRHWEHIYTKGDFESMNTSNTTTYGIINPIPGLGWAQEFSGINFVNVISTLYW